MYTKEESWKRPVYDSKFLKKNDKISFPVLSPQVDHYFCKNYLNCHFYILAESSGKETGKYKLHK
jgi:hypothetical protein